MIHLKCPARIFQLVCDPHSMAVHGANRTAATVLIASCYSLKKKTKTAICKVQLQVDDKDTMLGSQTAVSTCEWRCLCIFLHT